MIGKVVCGIIVSNLSECLCVHSVERSGSPVRAHQAKGDEGVSRKAREVSGKSSFQEEGRRSKQRGRSGGLEPSSPIHNALGQVCVLV